MTEGSSFWNRVARREGHFLLESGHHGALWLTLETLFSRPASLAPFVSQLASALVDPPAEPSEQGGVEVVCGPLVEGAFLALEVARTLGVPFSYSVPMRRSCDGSELFGFDYVIPDALTDLLLGKRVAIVNDFINAGSAVRGTIRSLESIGARVQAIACLGTLGAAAPEIAAESGARLIALEHVENAIWTPRDCPLCQVGRPLEDPGNFG